MNRPLANEPVPDETMSHIQWLIFSSNFPFADWPLI